MKRSIIHIDEDKCTGCGVCIPNCPEGALQVIDGKARVVSDLLCDGLGACVGHCPEDAMTIEERDAEEYDEKKVIENIVKQGENVVKAHLEHLRDHGQTTFLEQALDYLKENNIDNPLLKEKIEVDSAQDHTAACPGMKMMDFSEEDEPSGSEEGTRQSPLRQWPIQLHLVSPLAPYFQGRDVILSADCVAYAVGDFHKDFLKDKSLVIACPKLDTNKEIYVDKIIALIDHAKINTLTVVMMEVPCCRGLLMIVQEAAEKASRKVPVKRIIVSLKGEVLEEEWL